MKSISQEEQYKARANDWASFIESSIWHDIQLFILDRIELNRSNLEQTDDERRIYADSTNGYYESSDILRGRNREARDILMAPEEILKELREGEEDDRRDDT